MATRNIVPRATGEGSIGTPEKTWGSINAEEINMYSERTAPVNTLQRETAYVVDDIVYTSKLNAKYYLLCITAGTTGSVEPSFVGAESNTQITDGTVVWRVQTVTSQENADEKVAQAKEYTDSQVATSVPIGCVQAYAGNTLPNGWLLCDGSAVSRTDYAALFAVIGTTYGSGDGSTTFNLPNLIDKFIQGNATSGTEHSAGLPNITGDFALATGSDGGRINLLYPYVTNGAFVKGTGTSTTSNAAATDTKTAEYDVHLDASRSSSIYGNSTTVQPPALTMRYIIKY